MLKLRRPAIILRKSRPIIRSGLILIRAYTNHRLDDKPHPRLRRAHRHIHRIMRDVRPVMKESGNLVSARHLDDTIDLRLRVLFYDAIRVSERHAGFHDLDC